MTQKQHYIVAFSYCLGYKKRLWTLIVAGTVFATTLGIVVDGNGVPIPLDRREMGVIFFAQLDTTFELESRAFAHFSIRRRTGMQ